MGVYGGVCFKDCKCRGIVFLITLRFHINICFCGTSFVYLLYENKNEDTPKNECSKCKGPLEPNRIGKRRYCLSCHNEYMRNHTPKLSPLQTES